MSGSDAVHWPGRGHVALFIRCLHLLDLDLLEDWPAINEQTFNARVSQQNMHSRTKAVEWSLYRLFELYSPTETRDKLRPFFPPMTSLQSVNLRAALLRVLTELKRNGILPKEVVLRKTMLDECKGERFEELLSIFANLVLRKVTRQPNGQSAVPEHIVNAKSSQEHHFVPLVLAHRHSMQKALQQRQQIEQQSHARHHELDGFSEALSERKSNLRNQNPVVNPQRGGSAIQVLKGEWTGDSRWINAILHGEKPGHSLPQQSPEQTQGLSSSQIVAQPDDLLVDLNQRLRAQRERLARWKSFQRSLSARQIKGPDETYFDTPSEQPLLAFDKHQHIVPDSVGLHLLEDDVPEVAKTIHGPFTVLFDQLNCDLSIISASHPEAAAASQAIPEATHIHAGEHGEYTGSLILEDVQPVERWSDATPSPPEKKKQTSESPQALSPAIGSSAKGRPTASEFSWLNESREQSHENMLLESDGTDLRNHETLMDRTRKSMATLFTSDADTSLDSPKLPDIPVDAKPRLDKIMIDSSNRRGTLLERTRQSMATAARPHATAARPQLRATKARLKDNRMSLHPINQFGTPQKQEIRQSMQSPSSNGSTPREKLFSEDAEYTSIFKSRPKIAQSPAVSPDRSALDDSMLARDMTILDIGSDDVEYDSD